MAFALFLQPRFKPFSLKQLAVSGQTKAVVENVFFAEIGVILVQKR